VRGKVVGFYIKRRYIRLTSASVVTGKIAPRKKAIVTYYTKKKRHYAVSVVVKGASSEDDAYQTHTGTIGRVQKVRGRVVGFYIKGHYIRVTKATTVKGKIEPRKKAIVKYHTKKRRYYADEVIVQGAGKSESVRKTPTPKPRATKPAIKPTRTPKPPATRPPRTPRPTSAPVRRPTATPAG